jgi:hypothetical protein
MSHAAGADGAGLVRGDRHSTSLRIALLGLVAIVAAIGGEVLYVISEHMAAEPKPPVHEGAAPVGPNEWAGYVAVLSVGLYYVAAAGLIIVLGPLLKRRPPDSGRQRNPSLSLHVISAAVLVSGLLGEFMHVRYSGLVAAAPVVTPETQSPVLGRADVWAAGSVLAWGICALLALLLVSALVAWCWQRLSAPRSVGRH